MSIFANNNIEQ